MGLASDISEWSAIIAGLAQRFQVIAFDNRGAGRTSKPDQPYSIEQMADDTAGLLATLGVTRTRVLGSSPARHYMRIRLAKAHALLQQTDLGVTEIAMSAGFGSLEHFSRAYRARFGLAPSHDRRQIVSAPTMRRGGDI